MALERVFACPRTLRRFGRGPLKELLEGFCNWLLEQGFRRHTIRQHLFNLSYLNDHLNGGKREVRQSVSSREIARFFRAYPLQCRNRPAPEKHVCRMGYSINRFLDYLRHSGLLVSLPSAENLSAPYWTAISSGWVVTSMRPMERFRSAAIRLLSSWSGLVHKPRPTAYPG